MSVLSRFLLLTVSAALALSAGALALAQNAVVDPAKNDLPNPNPRVVKNWAPLPDGRTWGSTAGIGENERGVEVSSRGPGGRHGRLSSAHADERVRVAP